MCEDVREIVWKYHQWISQLEYMHFDTQHVEIDPKMAEVAKIAWNYVKIALNCIRECLKVSPLNFSAQVHAFWYPTCWNWPKNGWNSPNCVKIAWNCVKLREHAREIFESITNEFFSSSTCILIPFMLKLAKKWLKSLNCMKLRENCVKLRETQNTACLCQAGSKYISNSPIGLNMAEKSVWTEGNTHTHTC